MAELSLPKDPIMKNIAVLALVAVTFIFPIKGQAGENMLGFGLGYFDVFDGDDTAADFRVEYRAGEPCFWEIKPFIAGHINSDGGIYGLGGIYGDIPLSPEWTLTPSFGAGLYSDGDSKDLGHVIELRTQLELGYNFQNGSRLTGGLAHISNGGLDDHNPGTEVLSFNYYVPLSWFSSGNSD